MKKTILLATAVVVLFLCAAAANLFVAHDAQWYRSYVEKYGPVLEKIAQDPAGAGSSVRVKWAIYRGLVDHVSGDEAQVYFYLSGAPLEGHYMLVYAPEAAYEPACLSYYDNWRLVSQADEFARWTGGMADKACLELHDFGGGFYLEYAYLPT